jgi:peptidoglycan-associated lipoprotein
MRRLGLLLAFGTALAATTASAQPHVVQRVLGRAPPPPVLVGIDALRADFIARSGADTIYFGGDSHLLSPAARMTLAAQALWLRQHPEVVVRIEGHADWSDTRAHALAVGVRRAEEVRQYLVLLGVPAAQVTAVSMGKERPGPARAVTVLSLAAGFPPPSGQ